MKFEVDLPIEDEIKRMSNKVRKRVDNYVGNLLNDEVRIRIRAEIKKIVEEQVDKIPKERLRNVFDRGFEQGFNYRNSKARFRRRKKRIGENDKKGNSNGNKKTN